MARMVIKEGSWEDARAKAKASGIVLTRRTHQKGGYVCYAGKALREALARMAEMKSLPEEGIMINGKIS